MGELSGLSAIVTGSAQGIGAGITRVLANEGARIAITDLNGTGARALAQSITDGGGYAIGLTHDVAIASSCADVVAQARAALGPIDVLVNNAGISERVEFGAIDEAAWDAMQHVNLKGTYLMVRAVLNEMIERRAGRIINIASLAAKVGLPLFSHYSASKFAVLGFTQALAAELAPYGILVNAVCPGVVRTPLWDPELRGVAADRGISIEEAWNAAVESIPLRRPQDPEDIGHAVAFLASERARCITGEAINVNGGQLMD